MNATISSILSRGFMFKIWRIYLVGLHPLVQLKEVFMALILLEYE